MYSARMNSAENLKKRLDMIMSREKTKKASASAKTRNLGMPQRLNRRPIPSSHHLNNGSVGKLEVDRNDTVGGLEPKRRNMSSTCSSYKKKDESSLGNVFTYRGLPCNANDDGMSSTRLNMANSLQITPLKEEDYRGRIILTSRESYIQEEHFLPGLKFKDVSLRLNSSAINDLRLRQAFKAKDYKVCSTKKVIEIRIPTMCPMCPPQERRHSIKSHKAKNYFLYRHKEI